MTSLFQRSIGQPLIVFGLILAAALVAQVVGPA